MKKISSRLDPIKPSATMAMTQKAQELKAAGVDVIAFSAGEPDFDTPKHIVDAAKNALDSGFTRYTAASGTASLKSAVAKDSAEFRGVPCNNDNVLISVGAKHVLYNYIMAMVDKGDEVIIPSPYWVSYPDQVRLAGGKPVIVTTFQEDNWVLTPKLLEENVTPSTKILLLNTPSNPTGSVYSKEALSAVVNRALELGLYVLSDEIYRDLVYDGKEFVSALTVAKDNKEKVFVVDGVSKTYAMTGWRIGWGIGDPDIIKAMGKIQGQSTSNPTSFAQAAAQEAISSSKDFLDDWKAQYVTRRDLMLKTLNDIPNVSCQKAEGAFYLFPDVSKLIEKMGGDKNDIDIANWLLEEAKVATVPGTPFGAPGHIRLSYATSIEQIKDGLKRMSDLFATIN